MNVDADVNLDNWLGLMLRGAVKVGRYTREGRSLSKPWNFERCGQAPECTGCWDGRYSFGSPDWKDCGGGRKEQE